MNTRRWATAAWWVILGACLAGFILCLAGCGAPEIDKAKGVGWTAGGGAVGALFSPIGAAIGAGVGYLFGGTSSSVEPLQLNWLGRLGQAAGEIIWWVLVGYGVLLILVPKSRDNLLAALSSKMPVWDRLKSLLAGLIPSPHSPTAAQARKVKREAKAAPSP